MTCCCCTLYRETKKNLEGRFYFKYESTYENLKLLVDVSKDYKNFRDQRLLLPKLSFKVLDIIVFYFAA